MQYLAVLVLHFIWMVQPRPCSLCSALECLLTLTVSIIEPSADKSPHGLPASIGATASIPGFLRLLSTIRVATLLLSVVHKALPVCCVASGGQQIQRSGGTNSSRLANSTAALVVPNAGLQQ